MRGSMKLACAVLMVAVLAPVGCKSKQEKAGIKMLGLLNDYADALAGIKSNTQFLDAKPKLQRIGAQMKDMANEMKNLPKPSQAEQDRLQKKYQPQAEAAMKRIMTEAERLEKLGVPPQDLMAAMSFAPDMMKE